MARPRTAMREIREVLRLAHAGGLRDKLFVDYAGHTIPIYLPDGPSWPAQLFGAVLGISPAPPP